MIAGTFSALRPLLAAVGCLLALSLAAAAPLLANEPVTPLHTSLSEADIDSRLRFLEDRLEGSRTHGQVWFWSWMGIDVASAVWLGVQAGLDDHDDDAVNNAVNAGLGAIGVADLLLRPLAARHGADPIRSLPDQTRAEKIEKLRAAEALLRGNAQRAEERTSFALHAGNVGLNAAAGLIVALAGRPSDGLVTFAAGTAGGVINLLTAPWQPEQDWRDYRAMVNGSTGAATRPRVDVALAPLAGGAHLAMQIRW